MSLVISGIRSRVAVWVGGSFIGAALLALPDGDDERIVSLSDTHGPGVVDAVGVVLLVAAWLPVAALFWRERSLLASRRSGRCGLVVSAIGSVGVLVAIALDASAWWVAPVVLLIAAQLVLLRTVWSDESTRRAPDC
jgi:hypothetical protein